MAVRGRVSSSEQEVGRPAARAREPKGARFARTQPETAPAGERERLGSATWCTPLGHENDGLGSVRIRNGGGGPETSDLVQFVSETRRVVRMPGFG